MLIIPVIKNILQWMIDVSSMSSFTLQGSDWHYRCRPTPQPVLPAWRIPVLYTRLYARIKPSFATTTRGPSKHLKSF
jgi:hypothetical protein